MVEEKTRFITKKYISNEILKYKVSVHGPHEIKHGSEKWWYSDGSLWSEVNNIHGKHHGIERVWDRTGRLYMVSIFNNGRRLMYLTHKDLNLTSGKIKIK